MSAFFDNIGTVLSGFRTTAALFLVSAFWSLIVGGATSILRLSPISSLRATAGFYVGIMQATPVVLVFFLVTFGLPQIGLRVSFFTYAVIALTLYEASYICEAIRSGFNSVGVGQTEAARASGMSPALMMRKIILPQALANAVPAIGNNMIALNKATAIAGSFGVVEATAQLHKLALNNPGDILLIFTGVAFCYALMNLTIAALITLYEKKVVFLQ